MESKISFIDADGEKFTVDIECIGGRFSMSGSYVGGGGQCQDNIKPANDAQQRLVDMWDKYHLNDMNAGTVEQEELLEKYRNHVIPEYPKLCQKWLKEYAQQCLYLKIYNMYEVKHPETGEPYKYGHGWLTVPLPDDIEQQIEQLIKDIESSEGRQTGLSFGDEQAQEFLDKTGTKFDAHFVTNGIHFAGDKDKRDIYLIILTRGLRSYGFKYGQSIRCSGRFWKYGNYKRGVSMGYHTRNGKYSAPLCVGENRAWDKNKNFTAPTPYDVLSCLQKSDPEDFDTFCSEFGYDTDSRQAEKTYNAVKDEYDNLKMLYSDAELEQIAEIQ